MKPSPGNDPTARRREAEARLKLRRAPPPSRNMADLQSVQHELEVHQIELEMQGEELHEALAATTAALENYTDLYDFAPVGYFNLTRDGIIQLVNLTGAKLMGIERGRLQGRRFALLLAETGRRAFSDFLERVFAADVRQNYEVALATKDATTTFVRLEAALSADGQQCRVALSDITGRKQGEKQASLHLSETEQSREVLLSLIEDQQVAEKALRHSEARFRRIMESDLIGIIFWNANGDITEANDVFLRIVGHDREDLTSGRMRWRDMTPPEFQAQDEKALREVMSTGVCAPYEKEFFRKDGSRVPILIGATIWPGQPDAGVAFVLNITDRKKTEQARDYSLSMTSATLESTADGILVVDLKGKIETFNHVFVKMWRVPEDILSTKDDTKAIQFVLEQLSDPAIFLEKVNHLYSHPEEESFDTLEFKDGRAFERFSRPQFIGGQVVGRVWSFRDITKRLRTELRLAAFATLGRKLNTATDGVAAARIIVDIADELFGWDSCMLDLYDLETNRYESILTMDVIYGRRQDVSPARAAETPSARMKKVIQDGAMLILRETPQAELSDFTPFGDLKRPSASIMYVPVRDGKRVIGVLSIQSYRRLAYTQEDLDTLQDLADHCAGALQRLRGRDALSESEEKFSVAFYNSPIALVIGSLDGVFVEANHAFCDLMGYSREEIIGRNTIELGMLSVEARKILDEASENAGGQLLNAEIKVRAKDGSFRNILFSRGPIMFHGVQHRLTVGMDITDRKVAEQKLMESGEQLRALLTRLQRAQEEERIRVAREIHDELGQLLTGLKMDVRWLERKLTRDDLPPALKPLLDRAVGASELADQTLAVVQKIAGALRPGLLDHLGLGASLTQRARRFQEQTGIPCQVELTELGTALPPAVATELFYICQETLTNVTRHAQATEVHIRFEANATGAVLEVRDNGRGIAETDLTAAKSLGILGMRERAAHCGGTITWEQCKPQGTRVTVRIPLNEVSV